MSTLRVDTIQNAAGTDSPISVPGTAKAWVNFNGQGTVAIRASYNVSSITDNGVGNYTVNFTTALSDTNYCVAGSADDIASSTAGTYFVPHNGTAPTTTAVRIRMLNSTPNYTDRESVNVAIFR